MGLALEWPSLTRFKFWCSSLAYRDRLFLTNFMFGNGVPLDLYESALRFCNIAVDDRKWRHIRSVYRSISAETAAGAALRARYYYYNLVLGRVEHLDGSAPARFGAVGRIDPLARVGHPVPRPRNSRVPRSAEDARRRGYHCYLDVDGTYVSL